MKREVATQHYRVGFPWSKCQVMIPGDKSLYRTKYFCESRKRVVSAIREAEFYCQAMRLTYLSDERETHG